MRSVTCVGFGVGCVLSAALAVACDSGSSSSDNATNSAGNTNAGVGGGSAGNAGASGSVAGSSSQGGASAGTGNGGAANAGAANAGAGGNVGVAGGGSSGNGGTSPQGGVSNAGSSNGGGSNGGNSGNGGAANGGSSAGGSAGSAQGGSGGALGGSCNGASVSFLIQRSGGMFEQADPAVPNYWSFVQTALVGDGSATQPYEAKLPMGASFFFIASTGFPNTELTACPQLQTTAPALPSSAALAAAFSKNASDHAALVAAKDKVDAPVPEAINALTQSLSGVSGSRHVILIVTGVPDSCTKFDGPCAIDPSVKAVQDAKAAGITVHVIGLGDDPHFNYPRDAGAGATTGNQEFLQQLANAGAGKPVGPATVEVLEDYVCSSGPAVLTASYAGTAGDAKYYEAMSAADVKSAVSEILAGICP